MDSYSGSDEHISAAIKLINDYKSSEPGVVKKVTGKVLAPVNWLVGRLIPHSALMGALSGVDGLAKYTTTKAAHDNFENLEDCDRSVSQVINFHKALAAAEGAGTGWLGLPGLLLDIPAITVLAVRLVRQVGVEYGYGVDTVEEQQFVLSVLAAASANSQEEKLAALAMNAHVLNLIAKQTWKKLAEEAAKNKFGTAAAIMTVKEVAKRLGINITKRVSLAALPVIGAAVSAGANVWFMNDTGIAAHRLYQERWLKERDLWLESSDFVSTDDTNSDDPAHAS